MSFEESKFFLLLLINFLSKSILIFRDLFCKSNEISEKYSINKSKKSNHVYSKRKILSFKKYSLLYKSFR